MNNISAIVLTRDEEKNINKCLKSLEWADEIILVDDYSTDKTRQIARKYTNKIYKRKLNGDFAAQRNFALKKAKNTWILFVDADEIVIDKLKGEILNAVKSTMYTGYCINRKDLFNRKKMTGGEWGQAKIIRLAKKGAGKWRRKVNEYWDVKGEVGILPSPLLHLPHSSLRDFVSSINAYSSIHARENVSSGKSSNILKVTFFHLFKFLNNFIVKRGYRDGTEGFIMAVMMSFHSYLSWSKIYTKDY